jgi:superfamily II DNA or RNA helicase
MFRESIKSFRKGEKFLQFRGYQENAVNDIRYKWRNGSKNVMLVLPTGAGKTFVFAHEVATAPGPAVAIAHRKELIMQISRALNAWRCPHDIVAPIEVIRDCVRDHVKRHGVSYYRDGAIRKVISVDSLRTRADELQYFFKSVVRWVIDEAHHIARGNKWHNAIKLFTHEDVKGLGVTATPTRADRKQIAEFDSLVVGPSMRELIDQGYLSDYIIFAPDAGIDLSDVRRGNNGDFTRPTLKRATRRSRIIGDVVQHYKKHAAGKRGVTFVTDIETCDDIAAAYNAAGVPAMAVDWRTDPHKRNRAVDMLESGELLQLVNIDLFGEGFDLPAIECVSFARPTMSYGLYVQQFGRALRLMEGKGHAIIIDHVGNVERHKLPDIARIWSLDAGYEPRAKQAASVLVRVCTECTGAYKRVLTVCPYCGHEWTPGARTSPKFVDGDLVMLDAETLAAMRAAAEHNNRTPRDVRNELTGHLHERGISGHVSRQARLLQLQSELRDSMSIWSGMRTVAGIDARESMREFYLTYGVDVLSARALDRKESESLLEKIRADIDRA